MYSILLFLHSYTRWLVLLAMGAALLLAWTGWVSRRPWTRWDERAGRIFALAFSLQFVLGVLLYFQPEGMAQAAARDLRTAMTVRELRFFGLEHPLQMFVALGLTHLGSARSRKAAADSAKYRWAAICYSLAVMLVLTAIPYWRPSFRGPGALATPAVKGPAVSPGDPARGAVLFTQSLGGLPSCSTCHALTDQRVVGPGLGGVAQRHPQETVGPYLRESILNPETYVVPGYPGGVMPAGYGQALTTEQVDDLVAYLLSLE